MVYHRLHNTTTIGRTGKTDPRIRFAGVFVIIFSGLIIFRLFILMILQHSFYTALAIGSHEFYSQLFPNRGEIFVQDSRTGEEYPLAINRDYFLVYADTREIKDDKTAEEVAQKLAEVFGYDDEKKLAVYLQLNERDDPYEPIEFKVEEETAKKINELNLPGIALVRKAQRFYPEAGLAAQTAGFVGKTEDGQDVGRYGIEGYWQKELAGRGGFFEGMKSASGFWIPLAGRSLDEAEDGADILLTIDRTLQYKACEKLRERQKEFGAVSASLIILDPATGEIRTMCSMPDFDPNEYNKVDSVDVYNNTSIFTAYEPGSVFKPIVMAAALNEKLVKPETTFFDAGYRDGFCQKPIKNAGEKSYGTQNMTGVLENSINTGMVFVAEKLGKEKMISYLEDFGFGTRQGIELDSEVPGTIEALDEKKGDKIDCYAATASFGQGITATPLQLVSAYAALINGGVLYKPYIVEQVRYADGKVERFYPREVRRVIDNSASALISGMMVSVVDSGHATLAAVKGYYVGGKTGTAQIAGKGGYTQETNHTFLGFAPVENPKFVMLVKFEKPARAWADGTTAPVFGELAKFILQYYQVPPGR
jgi:cell division protein FtsI (penicillin-binding protein 3)/stage V sporulation protein D (sporulation-specific penicillin-binding protein)